MNFCADDAILLTRHNHFPLPLENSYFLPAGGDVDEACGAAVGKNPEVEFVIEALLIVLMVAGMEEEQEEKFPAHHPHGLEHDTKLLVAKKHTAEESKTALAQALEKVTAVEPFSVENLEHADGYIWNERSFCFK